MFLSDLFIQRPVFAIVVSLLIVVGGIMALRDLPVRELPDVDASVVTVTTTYTGAAPAIVDTEITELIEGAVARIDGVKRIESGSSEGVGQTRITFTTGRDIDSAAADVREAVGSLANRLPEEADEPRVVKADSDSQPVMRVSLTSDRLSGEDLTDLAERVVVDRLTTVSGVGEVTVSGARRRAIRVWLDSEALAARGLTVGDVETALRRANVELPSGRLESSNRQLAVRVDSRLKTIEEFRSLAIAQRDGYPIRLSELAKVELGVEDDRSLVRTNGENSITLRIIRQSRANTLAVSAGVRAELERIRPQLPDGVRMIVATDDALFIQASIDEVVVTLLIAVGVVVLVIFAFLYSLRATLIPALTIPVSIIGAFMLLAALGFSINLLTLLALILAIGLVVDDAIVVLENAQRRVDHGEPPLVAAYRGTRQVTFAVLATSAVLVAVYVPLSLLGGEIGKLFQEFGLVLAAAVAISTFVALSLTPMLCSQLLGRGAAPNRFMRAAERAFAALERGYRAALGGALAMPLVVLTTAALLSGAALLLYRNLPQELVPSEDRGVFFISIKAPEGATLAFTDAGVRKIEQILQPLFARGEAWRLVSIVGRGDSNQAFVVVGLSDWSQRARGQQAIVNALRGDLRNIPDLRAIPISRSSLGRGASSQAVQLVIGGPDYPTVVAWSEAIMARARDNPGLTSIDSDYQASQPTLRVEIDRALADELGIPVERIAATLQTLLASREITTYIDRGREYSVLLQAQAIDRRQPGDLAGIFVRADKSGELAPLGAVVELREDDSALTLRRFDRLPAVTIDASLVGDYDLGRAIVDLNRIAAETLPVEARVSFTGAAESFLETSGGLYFTFGLALLIVFLVLAAQFESFIHPFIILLTVPVGVTGALLALSLTGQSINLYSQIGCVLLIGLMAKNGILIVEFANQMRAQGLDTRAAVLAGASQRLRPILMTVLSTVLGAVPLALATGAGAESRIAIGVVVIGGLLLSTTLTLFLTPVLYDLLARFTRPVNAIERRLTAQLRDAAPAAAALASDPLGLSDRV
ncbi:efflux RND transporter permease subunit [Candidatus Competibacter phosphatis]|uniref:Efflux RND transporter permease subunit n=1 Tax=Candidatus Competibacter phosphatis TaxID=221280 RepID=A0ABX1TK12_9GAMM|nr:efflux RND transporter permease subunit [Candidatus Competibacter phosphatis]NMQ18999.1 efflux RND transporter permease subunit [Candidatus Competibacter phosphatis]